ncbi:MAG: sodium:solute symporter family protein [Planctomycetes bacterium]|nr:sodium:solute symporter family protein [Planctomycetota bacterium]
MTGLLFGILVYVLVQVAIGIWVARRVKSEDDYFVAGRRLSPLVAAISVTATWFGAETCMSGAGDVYGSGITRFTVEPFAYGACILVAGLFLAVPLWRRGITTTADLLRERYGVGVERLAAVLLVPTSVLWAAAQIRAFGHVLQTSSELDFSTCLAIGAGITILYTSMGGLLADVVTDVVQGAALLLGLGVVLVGVVMALGGPGEAWSAAYAERAHVVPDAHTWLDVLEAWSIPVLGSVLAQEMLSRCLAARSAGAARFAALGGGSAYLLIGLIPVFLGLVGPSLLPGLEDHEQIVPALAREHLSPFFYVIFAGALISAILSTVDSALLVASAFLTRNVLLSLTGERASPRARLLLARATVVGAGLVAWVLALRAEHIQELVEEASGFGSSGMLVAVLFGLFTRIGGKWAAYGALIAGLGVWVAARHGGVEIAAPYLASLAAALLGYLIGALLREPRAAARAT